MVVGRALPGAGNNSAYVVPLARYETMSDNMRLFLWVLAGLTCAGAFAGLLFLAIRSIHYRVTSTHLKVRFLGVTVRRVRLDNIRHIGNKPAFWAEPWARGRLDP